MSVSHKLVTIAAMTALAGAIIYQKIQLRTLENELANAAAEIATLRNQVTEFEIRKAKFENVKPDASSDVLKLRAEVTQVRASRLETESTDESAARALGKRADQVKKWLRETPGEYIPELQLLTDKEILVEIAQAPETADNEWIAGVLRKHAKERFAGELGRALNDYVRQHEGQLPNDARELAPIISTSVPLEVFDRYSTVPGRATNEVPANEALIVEREPIQHSQYDARFRIGLYDYWYEKVDEFGESGRRNHTEKRQTEVTN